MSCDTKCCHTNVVADPTIIDCDEDVMLWGKMFDCITKRFIIGLKVHFFIESGLKMIQLKTKSKIFIQKIFIQLSKGIQCNYLFKGL